MNTTKIEYVDKSWSPVTGCFGPNGELCPYCFANSIVNRFQGYALDGENTTYNPYDGIAVLETPMYKVSKYGVKTQAPFPFGFEPTLHKYRLNEPSRYKSPKTIFVCTMADLFHEAIPDDWIMQVFDACRIAPWHRYLFLTKNPKRYYDLALAEKLIGGDNIWLGSTITTPEDMFMNTIDPSRNAFISIEPILSDFGRESAALKEGGIKWAVLGAETGSRKGKVIPKKRWVQNIVESCRDAGVPLFMKNNIIPYWDNELITELPWRRIA